MKPKAVPEGSTALPLIMVHGWPGSFYEFYGLIPLLTEPSDPSHLVFEVVCPSIPGYGFSEAPHKKGESGKLVFLQTWEYIIARCGNRMNMQITCTCICKVTGNSTDEKKPLLPEFDFTIEMSI